MGKEYPVEPPNEEVLRKIVNQFKNKDNMPHNLEGINMIGNVLHGGETANKCMKGKS